MMYGEVDGLDGVLEHVENGANGGAEDGLTPSGNPDPEDPNSYGNEYEGKD